jgi:hypothetical protein
MAGLVNSRTTRADRIDLKECFGGLVSIDLCLRRTAIGLIGFANVESRISQVCDDGVMFVSERGERVGRRPKNRAFRTGETTMVFRRFFCAEVAP